MAVFGTVPAEVVRSPTTWQLFERNMRRRDGGKNSARTVETSVNVPDAESRTRKRKGAGKCPVTMVLCARSVCLLGHINSGTHELKFSLLSRPPVAVSSSALRIVPSPLGCMIPQTSAQSVRGIPAPTPDPTALEHSPTV